MDSHTLPNPHVARLVPTQQNPGASSLPPTSVGQLSSILSDHESQSEIRNHPEKGLARNKSQACKRKHSHESDTICTACGESIFSCFDACLHPLLNVLICKKCHDNYGDGDFSAFPDYLDEYGDENYCRWCCDGGNLLVCANIDYVANKKCHYSFCQDCIKRNIPDFDLRKINLAFPFICFSCDPSRLDDLRKESISALKILSGEQSMNMSGTERDTISQEDLSPQINNEDNESSTDTDLSDSFVDTSDAMAVYDGPANDEMAVIEGSPANTTTYTTVDESDKHTATNHSSNGGNFTDADDYYKYLKRDDMKNLPRHARVFNAHELSSQINSIKAEKKLIMEHHTKFFDRLLNQCQACVEGKPDDGTGRVLLKLMRDQSWIEVKNLFILYRKIDSLIENLPMD